MACWLRWLSSLKLQISRCFMRCLWLSAALQEVGACCWVGSPFMRIEVCLQWREHRGRILHIDGWGGGLLYMAPKFFTSGGGLGLGNSYRKPLNNPNRMIKEKRRCSLLGSQGRVLAIEWHGFLGEQYDIEDLCMRDCCALMMIFGFSMLTGVGMNCNRR